METSKPKRSRGEATKGIKTEKKASDSRIPSGIVGLDEVMEGGLRNNTVTTIIGASGTGKSTFAMQYILEGLDNGEQGLFITLDVEPEQIVQEAIIWGWERIQQYVDKALFFFAATGGDFRSIINEQLPVLVKAREQYQTPTRVVIDALTPIMWAEKDRSVQRELIGKLFTLLKKMGSVVATVEQHGETIGSETQDASTAIFLADNAIYLRYQPIGGAFNRTLEIIKMRGTRHGEEVYPFIFSRGVGAIVRTTPVFHKEKAGEHDRIFEQAISAARREKAPDRFIHTLVTMKENWAYDFSPQEALEKLLAQHNIRKRG